ncbi:MAG: hypothetical protein JKY15_07750 [Deltaproteobacteria bacterium]|nr:hypothetical protein [Deltaproteobacteria bacterium]
MRQEVQQQQINNTLKELAKRCKGPGRVYLTGGTTAVLMGWRESTHDIDMKFRPEPPGIFEAIRVLKDELQVNIELASPDDFLPPLPGWEDRSILIGSYNQVEFYHYDYYAQALSKIQRGHKRDLLDVENMFAKKLITPEKLRELFQAIEPDLIRYPSISPKDLKNKLETTLGRIS